MVTEVAIDVLVDDRAGVLHKITEVILNHKSNIDYVDIAAKRKDKGKIYFEIGKVTNIEKLKKDLTALDFVHDVAVVQPFSEIYGKRIIIIGGGAQVAEVAKGAISEADRHNIRGEKISVDTIPLVGEEKIEEAVLAVARLPRVKALVLAGSIMGGSIADAVKIVRERGINTISLNMVGSVPDACDLIVTDPIQAGVMAVMSVSDNAEFEMSKQRGKKY